MERQRKGEKPSIEDYAARYPHLAEDIRVLFPTLLVMEQAGEPTESLGDAKRPKPIGIERAAAERLGDYRILRELGRGGMGVVYEAEHESLGRRVALKVLPRSFSSPQYHARFQREARAAAKLHHSNIVPVFDFGEQDGQHFYVMQYIHGVGLDLVIDSVRALQSRPAQREDKLSAVQPSAEQCKSARNLAESLVAEWSDRGMESAAEAASCAFPMSG